MIRTFSIMFGLLSFLLLANICMADVSLNQMKADTGLTEQQMATVLQKPLTINQVLEDSIKTNSGGRFLQDVNLHFKTFTTDDGKSSVGVSYDFQKNIKKMIPTGSSTKARGMSISVKAEGNISFNPDVNPKDFLDTNLSLHYFWTYGGGIKTDDALKTKLNDLSSVIATKGSKDIQSSKEFKEFSKIMNDNISPFYYLDASFVGGLESNQKFTSKQYYYGAQAGIDVKSWSSQSALNYYNIVDVPFAVIRYFSGADADFTPRGLFPTVQIGIDMVNPESGVVVSPSGNKDNFGRFRTEVAFRTPLGDLTKDGVLNQIQRLIF